MAIFRKKRKETTLNDIFDRLRGFLLDSQIKNAHDFSMLLGCPPLSDELAEKEEQESDKRTERIAYLIPMIYAHAFSLADASTEYDRNNVDFADKIPPEIWTHNKKVMSETSVAVLLGSISQLVDMGLLQIPKGYR